MIFQAFAVQNHPTRVALRSALPLIAADAPKTWVQLAHEGKWGGHAQGAFEFTPEVFQTVIRNFTRQSNPVPLTYEHPGYQGDGTPIIAAGWVHELVVKRGKAGVELWGLTEFTQRAATFVRNGEYRFCSVVIDFASKDRKTGSDVGPELLEVGLTNVPFIDGMQPIRLSRRALGRAGEQSMSDKELILAAIKALGDDADMDKIAAWVKAEKEKLAIESGDAAADKGAPGPVAAEPAADMATLPPVDALDASAPPVDALAASEPQPLEPVLPAEETAAAVDMAKIVEAIAGIAGVDIATLISFMQEKAEDVGEMIREMLAGEPSGTSADVAQQSGAQAAMSRKLSMAENTVSSLQKQVAELVAEKAERDKAAAEVVRLARRREVEAEVEAAIASGKALDAEREDLIKVRETDPEWFVRMLSARGQVVPVGPAVTPKPPAAAAASADDELTADPEYRAHYEALGHLRMSAAKKHEAVVRALRKLRNDRGDVQDN